MSQSWWNGRPVAAEEVRIPADDSGFLFGDGLFETLRVDDGRPLDVAAHLDRLFAGLQRVGIGLPEDRDALERAVSEVADSAPRPTARLRITISRGTRLVAAFPYEPPGKDLYREGVAVVLLPELRIDSRGPLTGLKSLSYQMNRLALREAEARGAWEALLLNEQGRLVEGSRSNVALVLPGGIFTPPVTDGCLPGTIRRRLLEAGAIREGPLPLADVERGSGLLLMNSLIGVLPVSRIDGREVPVGPEGERLRGMLPTPPAPPPAARRPPPS